MPAASGMMKPTMVENRAKAKSPATIEGMPVITSTRKVMALPSLFLPDVFDEVDGRQHTDGDRDDACHGRDQDGAHDRVVEAACDCCFAGDVLLVEDALHAEHRAGEEVEADSGSALGDGHPEQER